MADTFINLDAYFLGELSKDIAQQGESEIAARLLTIARNLQRMDDRQSSTYARGFRAGKDSHLAHSNLIKTEASPNLEEALKAFKGEVTIIPPVEKKKLQPEMTAEDLDLDWDFE